MQKYYEKLVKNDYNYKQAKFFTRLEFDLLDQYIDNHEHRE